MRVLFPDPLQDPGAQGSEVQGLRRSVGTTGHAPSTLTVQKLHFLRVTSAPVSPSGSDWPHPAPDSPTSLSLRVQTFNHELSGP